MTNPIRDGLGAVAQLFGGAKVTLRTESWDGPRGSTGGLLMVSVGRACICVGLRRDPVTEAWTEALGRFPAHAVVIPLQDAVYALPWKPARAGTLRTLGLLPSNASLVAELQVLLAGHGRETPYILVGENKPLTRDGPSPRGRDPDGFAQAMAAMGLLPAREREIRPLHDASSVFIEEPAIRRIAPRPGPDAMRVFDIEAPAGELHHFMEPWRLRIHAGFLSDATDFVHPVQWTSGVEAFFQARGDEGKFRRQAGRLHPRFAPALANVPELSAAVDAGRPFEALLLERLLPLLPDEERPGLTLAKLRRMRGLAEPYAPWDLGRLLSVVARLPVGRLPATPEGWEELYDTRQVLVLDEWFGRHNLPLADVLPGEGCGRLDVRNASGAISDMVNRCADGLVQPLIACDDDPDRPFYEYAYPTSMRLLFGGKDFVAMTALADRWHARLAAFEAELPRGEDRVTWPALFEPQFRKGYRISCLTTPTQLFEEGGHGDDGDGMSGLAHCVGGYARRCYSGESHILSIRKRTLRGWVRVSTAEITVTAQANHHVVPIGLRQHRGARNAEPPASAIEAFDEVLADIGNMAVPVNPEARRRRDPNGFVDGLDRGDPAVQEATLAAWRPYLSRSHARLDRKALRVLLLGWASGMD